MPVCPYLLFLILKKELRAKSSFEGVTISEEVPTAFTEVVGVVETTISLNAEGNINIVEELVPRGRNLFSL
jgi:hypothetical protein